MTRINCIPIEELTRKHCFSEYKELPRVRHYKPRRNVPKTYRMGTGHVLFFMNKGAWLEQRHQALHDHLVEFWKYKIKNIPVLKLNWPAEFMGDWVPEESALAVSRGRIEERLRGTERD